MIGFKGVSTGVGLYYGGGGWVGCGISLAVDKSSGPVYRGC